VVFGRLATWLFRVARVVDSWADSEYSRTARAWGGPHWLPADRELSYQRQPSSMFDVWQGF
jgi:hypothetical protein